jgi:hypothetical protein
MCRMLNGDVSVGWLLCCVDSDVGMHGGLEARSVHPRLDRDGHLRIVDAVDGAGLAH